MVDLILATSISGALLVVGAMAGFELGWESKNGN